MTAEIDEQAGPPPVRRDFLTLLTLATASVGGLAFAWPFLDSLNNAGNDDAAGTAVEVDLSHLAPGQQIVVQWRGNPVFVLRRTPEALQRLQEPALQARLRDPASAEHQQPDYARNWHRSAVPEFAVMVGVCTHLGCVPRFRPVPDGGSGGDGWPGGYLCPCHGSRFDLAGRVFGGAPALYNLPVPPYIIAGDRLRIGDGPPGSRFSWGGIVRI